MKYKLPEYVRDGALLHEVKAQEDAFGNVSYTILRTKDHKSISRAKKESALLQGKELGAGKVRTAESMRKAGAS